MRVLVSRVPLDRECPKCVGGIGIADRTVVLAGRPGLTITLTCHICFHEWHIQPEPDQTPGRTPPEDTRES
jgi:hypothetical protein